MSIFARSSTVLGLLVITLILTGCVERRLKITTNPPGALVTINDEEVGATPAKFSFLWYGDYDIIVRKPGYETLKTHYRITAPWYQWPFFDLIAETLVPWTIVDEHTVPELQLVQEQPPTVQEIVDRATQLREQAIFGS
ncbi:MAG: PEGA domain-containing protein [Phycisphaerae bacterium]